MWLPTAARPRRIGHAFQSQQRHARDTGTIKPRYESDLGFRVSGKIVERLINIGDMVTPGMTLARLDATDYRLSLESADAELTAAESSLAQADADESRYARPTQGGWTSDRKLRPEARCGGRSPRPRRAGQALPLLAKNQLDYTSLRGD